MREREKKNLDNHLGTPQNILGTPLGVPTPTLGTTVIEDMQMHEVSGKSSGKASGKLFNAIR